MKVIKTYEQLHESNPCWTGYKQVGTKMKDGKRVPNCVPVVEESASSPEPLGFVISFSAGNRDFLMNYTIAGIYDTFYEFASAVNEDIGYSDEDEPMEFKDVEDLMDHVYEAIESREGDWKFWHGFALKPGAKGYHSEENLNCYKVSEMLENLFVNPKDIIAGKEIKNSLELSYLAKSVQNDPEKLLMYEDNQEMYKKIVKLLNWDQKKLDAFLKVQRIKNQF
jgi:hypothetical protein